MRTPAIVPTVTQRVRTFLAEQGAGLRPWAGLQEIYDELYALLRQRRSDAGFWQPLKGLLEEVIASAASAKTRGTELLISWKVDALVDELRDALPVEANGVRSTRTDFTRTLSTAVLGGFLLLGLAAAGCGGGGSTEGTGGSNGPAGSGGQVTMVAGTGGDTGTGGMSGTGGASLTTLQGTGGAGPGTGGAGTGGGSGGLGGAGGTGAGTGGGSGGAVDASLGGAGGAGGTGSTGPFDAGAGGSPGREVGIPACLAPVDPGLDRAIGESSLDTKAKSQLCECFAALSTSWTTSLTQLFATATPAEISKMLSGLVPCCHSTGITTRYGASTSPSSSDLSAIKSGAGSSLCAVPIYRGVSFPD